MKGAEFLSKYVALVKEMQTAQDNYFHCKTAKGYSDRTLLQKAKDLESKVKIATKEYYNSRDQLTLNF